MKYETSVRTDPGHVDGWQLLGAVLSGADDGHFGLPADVTAARSALAAAEAIPEPPVVDVAEARDELVAGIVRAAEQGTKVPTARKVIEAMADAAEADELRQALAEAVRRLGRRRDALLMGSAETIIVEHLRPAHDAAVAEAEAAVGAIVETGAEPAEVLAASEVLVAVELREHRTVLDGARRRYEAILGARGALVRANGGPSVDVQSMFGWARNGDGFRHASATAPPPWPTDALAGFVWRVTGPAELWCPTGDDQDARFEEVFADGLAAQRNSRQATVGAFIG